ncbi:MAG TPA: DNA polymerase IV [Thermohalobaculum sp.]|nr:DNA polymerase IV [Thermohalobaculum sp.]
MQALCRDCLSWFDRDPGRRCPACARPRLVRHEELGRLGIAHMDCDAFYAAVEKREDPALADRPLIVGGGRRGVVTTCCYIARIAGVRSAMPMFRALKLCPEAVVLKPRMELYARVGRDVRAMMLELTPLVEPLSLDEAFLDLVGTERLFGAPPALSLARLAARIEREVGITISIGLSHNKFLAKMASDLDKPRGFSVIGRAETEAFLGPRPVGAIWGVGPALGQRLERDGLRRIADLRGLDRAELMRRYGRLGQRLHDLSRGIDPRTVSPNGTPKSISSETTFDDDLSDTERLRGHLWRLAVRTSDRAKAAGLAGGTVTLKLKTAAFRPLSRQVALARPTQLATTIDAAAEPLLLRMMEAAPFRLIGVGLSHLSAAGGTGDPGLFGPAEDPRERAERASDTIRARFGTDAIVTGRALR